MIENNLAINKSIFYYFSSSRGHVRGDRESEALAIKIGLM